jgi:hypothetical protein
LIHNKSFPKQRHLFSFKNAGQIWTKKIEIAWRRVFESSNKILKEKLLVPVPFSDETSSEKEVDSDSEYVEIIPKKTKRSK